MIRCYWIKQKSCIRIQIILEIAMKLTVQNNPNSNQNQNTSQNINLNTNSNINPSINQNTNSKINANANQKINTNSNINPGLIPPSAYKINLSENQINFKYCQTNSKNHLQPQFSHQPIGMPIQHRGFNLTQKNIQHSNQNQNQQQLNRDYYNQLNRQNQNQHQESKSKYLAYPPQSSNSYYNSDIIKEQKCINNNNSPMIVQNIAQYQNQNQNKCNKKTKNRTTHDSSMQLGKMDGIFADIFKSFKNKIIIEVIIILLLILTNIFLLVLYSRKENIQKIYYVNQASTLKEVFDYLVIFSLFTYFIFKVYSFLAYYTSVEFAVNLANQIDQTVRADHVQNFNSFQACTSSLYYDNYYRLSKRQFQSFKQVAKSSKTKKRINKQIVNKVNLQMSRFFCSRSSFICDNKNFVYKVFGIFQLCVLIFGIVVLCITDTSLAQKIIFIAFIVYAIYNTFRMVIFILLIPVILIAIILLLITLCLTPCIDCRCFWWIFFREGSLFHFSDNVMRILNFLDEQQ